MTLIIQCTACQRALTSTEFIARAWRQLDQPADRVWARCSFCRARAFTVFVAPRPARGN